MQTRSQRHLPYLSGFLRYASTDPVKARFDTTLGAGIVATLIGTPILSLATIAATRSPLATIIVGSLAFLGFSVGTFLLAAKRGSPRTEAERAKAELKPAAIAWQGMGYQGRLHRDVDPMVSELLEAAAYQWTRIRTQLESIGWSNPDVPDRWHNLREHTQAAADRAMAELLRIATPAIGVPQRSKESDIQNIVSDIASMEISMALDGLKRVAKGDWKQYAHQSPHAQAILDSGIPIAERIAQLAGEVEALVKASSDSMTIPSSPMVDSLDLILSEVKAVRAAEDEYRLQQRIGE